MVYDPEPESISAGTTTLDGASAELAGLDEVSYRFTGKHAPVELASQK
jgi:hypothetical protein